MYRKALVALATTSLTAFAVPAMAQQSTAQPTAQAPAAENSDTVVQDIVVTAQRRSERLQDVPIAISAVGNDALVARGVTDLTSLRAVTPGLTITGNAGVAAGAVFAIRGISGQPLPIGGSQATAIYLDGVYIPRADGALFNLYDIERVEVVRGPQGTLYGRNATAGAINIITQTPGDTVQGGFDVSTGNFKTVEARGALSGPLGGGFSGGVSGSYSTRDGYFFNTVTNSQVPGRRAYSGRAKLRYASPDDSFTANLSGDYSKTDGAEFVKTVVSPTGAYIGLGDPSQVASNTGDDTTLRIKSYGAGLTLDYKPSDKVTLTSVTGYRYLSNYSLYDGDGSALPILRTGGLNTAKSISEELRALVTLPRFRATVGANYYHESGTFGLSVSPATAPVLLTSPYDTSKVDAYAVFGQVEYDLLSSLTVVGGLRYNHEKRDFTTDYRQAFPVAGLYNVGNLSDDVILPSIGINFKPVKDVLLYAKASEGYQAPGFNFAPGAFSGPNTFKAEKLWSYEVGAKTQFFDRRVTLNVAGFYYDYKDLQVRSVTAPGVTVINNAASATLKGAEAELTIRPFKGLTLGGHVTYVDAKYDTFCEIPSAGAPLGNDPVCAGTTLADRSGNRLSYAPKWSGGVNANYATKLTETLGMTAFVGYTFESNAYDTTANEAAISTGGFHKLDARVGFQFGNAEIYVYGKNLTDYRYAPNLGRFAATIAYGVVNDPRLYGVGLRYRF